MAAEILLPLARVTDANANPYSGAKWHFYETGTTTPQAVYADADLNVSLGSTVTADSGGKFVPIYFDGSKVYRGVCENASGSVTLHDIDPINSSFIAALVSPTGSSLIGFLQSGAGAVATTLQENARHTVLASQFAALQDALNRAAGGVLRLTVGQTYNVSTALSVPADTWIDARGATLATASAISVLDFADGGGITGGTITGPGNASLVSGSMAIRCSGANNAPAAPTYVRGPQVRGVKIDGFGEYGCFFAYTNHSIVEDCEITNIGYAGIGGVSCNFPVARDNRIVGVGPGSGDEAHGIYFDRKNGTSEVSDPRSCYGRITGNWIEDVVSMAGSNGHGLDTHAGVGFVIADNDVVNCQGGIFLVASKISGVNKLAPKGCRVIGNRITSTLRVNNGIIVAGALDGSTIEDFADDNIVSNNLVVGHGKAADPSSGAYFISLSRRVVVTGNQAIRPACNGIVLGFEARSTTVTGNQIVDPYDDSYTSPSCILVTDDGASGQIADNDLSFVDGALGTYVAVASIRINEAQTNLGITISRNTLRGTGASNLQYIENTSAGVFQEGLVTEKGSGTLSGGTLAVLFNQRFPVAPQVLLQNNTAANAMFASAITTTGFTANGTGTNAFTWRAST